MGTMPNAYIIPMPGRVNSLVAIIDVFAVLHVRMTPTVTIKSQF